MARQKTSAALSALVQEEDAAQSARKCWSIFARPNAKASTDSQPQRQSKRRMSKERPEHPWRARWAGTAAEEDGEMEDRVGTLVHRMQQRRNRAVDYEEQQFLEDVRRIPELGYYPEQDAQQARSICALLSARGAGPSVRLFDGQVRDRSA